MKKSKRFSRGIMCIILCLTCVCTALPVAVSAADGALTVKVGFFEFDGYHMEDENGNRSGYGYEILQHIAGYAGFRYEYVGYDKSWSEMQDMLESGEIDLLTSAQKTDERMNRFDFSSVNIGVSTAILTKLSDNEDYSAEDYENWNGIRVGMIEGNSRNDSLSVFAREHGFSFEPVCFEDTESLLRALKTEKSVDAVLTSNLRRTSGESIIAEFDSSPFYVIVKKGNAELLNKINYALGQMDIRETGFRTKLMNTYYASREYDGTRFTSEEREYIASMENTSLKLIINPDREPYSYIKDGKTDGSICFGLLGAISGSGLKTEFVDVKSRPEYWQCIKDGEYDILLDAKSDYNEAETSGCWQTAAYLEVPLARLYNENTVSFPTVALVRNSNVADSYSEKLISDGIAITYYDSVADVARAVLNGKQSMALLPINTAAVEVRDDVTNRLVYERLYGYSVFYSVNVSMKQNPLLFSVISKCVAGMTEQDKNNLGQYYASDMEKPFSLIGYIYDYPIRIGCIVIGAAILLIALYIFIHTLKKRKTDLALLEKERTQKEELREALGRAQIAVEAKSRFMSMISHEIRTPLNAVIGYNTIARNDMTEARTEAERKQAEMKVMDCLTKSDIASRHLLTIINDVLDMSAIESGKIIISHERFDFKGLVNSLTAIFYTQAKAKGVELEVIFDTPTEEWFVGDQVRTNQIVTNLLSNAIKFTSDKGNVRLVVRQENRDSRNADIYFDISDTGIGMTAEYLSHIWTPFEQADTSIARRFGGTGLGLSITKNLVELMGGSITVESEPGKGTAFHVKMTYARTEQPKNNGSFDFGDVNALVVDDDLSTCDYIRLLLGRFGARSAAATSGEEAVIAVTNAIRSDEPYTVCMVDWRMPKMDGLETIKQIRKVAGKDLPIIVITAYDYSEVAQKAAEIGVNTFISKPLFQSSLFNLLANMCGQTSHAAHESVLTRKFGGERVILAEDNMMNMEIAKNILKSAGLTVDGAWNGKEAVELFTSANAGTYKAILMDIQMPVMDGHEATRLIRKSNHPEAKTIPIIAMTADAFTENVAQALACGMNGHISKPIDISVLFDTLGKYIPEG